MGGRAQNTRYKTQTRVIKISTLDDTSINLYFIHSRSNCEGRLRLNGDEPCENKPDKQCTGWAKNGTILKVHNSTAVCYDVGKRYFIFKSSTVYQE